MPITAPTIIILNCSTCQLHFFFFFLPCHPAPSQFSQPGWSPRAETEPAPKYQRRQAAWSRNTNSHQQAWRQLQRSLHSNLTTLLILLLKAFVNGAILVLLILAESAVCINSTRQNLKEEMFVWHDDGLTECFQLQNRCIEPREKKKHEQLAG